MCQDGISVVAPCFGVAWSFSEVRSFAELPTVLSWADSYFSNSSFLQGNRKGSPEPGWRCSELPVTVKISGFQWATKAYYLRNDRDCRQKIREKPTLSRQAGSLQKARDHCCRDQKQQEGRPGLPAASTSACWAAPSQHKDAACRRSAPRTAPARSCPAHACFPRPRSQMKRSHWGSAGLGCVLADLHLSLEGSGSAVVTWVW